LVPTSAVSYTHGLECTASRYPSCTIALAQENDTSFEDCVARRHFQLEYLVSVSQIWSAKRKTCHYKSRGPGVGYSLRREHRVGSKCKIESVDAQTIPPPPTIQYGRILKIY